MSATPESSKNFASSCSPPTPSEETGRGGSRPLARPGRRPQGTREEAANPSQEDADADGSGDPCDLCVGDDATGDGDADGLCADGDCDDADPTNVIADGFEAGDTAAWPLP